MKRYLIVVVVIGLILNECHSLCAQDGSAKKKQEVFFGMGPTAYKGDLSDGFNKWTMSMHLGIKFNRWNKINGNFLLTIGSVTGQNIGYAFDDGNLPAPSPNRFFKTNVASINYEVHYNFINKENLKVYASQGMGILRFQPEDEFGEGLVDQVFTRAANETYGNITLILPTQIGVQYTLPNEFSVGLQLGFTNTLSDYIDNISSWSSSSGQDNIFSYRFLVYIPVRY